MKFDPKRLAELLPTDLPAFQDLTAKLVSWIVAYSVQVLGACIILALGWIFSVWMAHVLRKFLRGRGVDVTLAGFLASVLKLSIFGFALVIALGKFGITIAPFVAALGALAFGTSFAIQGPVSNYAAGLTLILTHPFTVGDTITVQGVSGVVEEVKLAYTLLLDEDGVRILIPNKDIVGQIIHNSSALKVHEGLIGVSYACDADKAVAIVQKAVASCEDVASDPGPQARIQSFGDSAVNIAYRCWVPTKKHFPRGGAVNSAVYRAVKEAGIDIPFPQREVRLHSKA